MTYTPVLAAFGGDFFTLFPTYLTKVSAFRNAIMLVGLVLSFAALLFSAYKAQYGNIAQLWRTLIAIAIVAIALTPFGFEDWIIKLAGATDNFVTTELGVDPATIPDKLWTYFKSDGSGGSKGFWDYLLDAHTAIIEMFMWGIVWLSSQCAILIKWWANFIQTALVYGSFAMSPIFIPMLLFNTTKKVGVSYILGTVAICLWPLGWGLADIMTDSLLQSATDKTVLKFSYDAVTGHLVYEQQAQIFLLAASLWIVFSTLAAPFIITIVFLTGANPAAEFLGAATGAGIAAGAAAVGVAAAGAGGGAAAPATTLTMTSAVGSTSSAGAGAAAAGGTGGVGSSAAAARSVGSAGASAAASQTMTATIGGGGAGGGAGYGLGTRAAMAGIAATSAAASSIAGTQNPVDPNALAHAIESANR